MKKRPTHILGSESTRLLAAADYSDKGWPPDIKHKSRMFKTESVSVGTQTGRKGGR